MPQPYEPAILTDEGEKLLAKAAIGQGQIEYVCMVVGCGSYAKEEKERDALKCRKQLKCEMNRYTFSDIKIEDKIVRLTALVTNQDPLTGEGLVEDGYYINEIGIYAKEKGTDANTAILYSMTITASDTGMGDYMPAYNGYRSEITQEYILSVDDSIQISVHMIGAVALAEDLEHHIGDMSNPHRTTKEQVGLGEADNTADRDKPVSTAQRAAIDDAYQQATGYTDTRIGQLIDGAPSTLDTLGEIAQAMKENADVVQAMDQAIGTRASQAEVDGHTGNDTIHITASERQTWNSRQTTTGDTRDNTVSFTSGDAASPAGWADVDLITSGEKHSSLWRKVSLFAKNVRYLWKLLGSTSLSGIGDGTVTGAISALNMGLGRIGGTVNGTVTPTTAPAGQAMTIGTITLPAGCWIIMANIWIPEIMTVHLYISNTSIDNGVMGMFRVPMVVGYVSSKTSTVCSLVFVQWSNSSTQVIAGTFSAFRIA